LNVPPLRERLTDIAPLAGYFLDQARTRLGLDRANLAPATIEALRAYSWPGNVRELEHVVLRAALRASADRGRSLTLQPEDLDIGSEIHWSVDAKTGLAFGTNPISLARAVDDFQRQLILKTLDECRFNWSETARRLGLDRGNLHRLARRLGLKPISRMA
jgi:anaerobic nitric oxide reductase transcription regulator